MPPNANPDLSINYFEIMVIMYIISKYQPNKIAGLNLSTHHEIGS